MKKHLLGLALVAFYGLACVAETEETENIDSLELEAKGGKKCGDPAKSYVSHDPDTCAAIHFICAEGSVPFFDRCGCGCTTAGVEACGASTCYPGEFCCNASCGICAPEGGACTQQACVPE